MSVETGWGYSPMIQPGGLTDSPVETGSIETDGAFILPTG